MSGAATIITLSRSGGNHKEKKRKRRRNRSHAQGHAHSNRPLTINCKRKINKCRATYVATGQSSLFPPPDAVEQTNSRDVLKAVNCLRPDAEYEHDNVFKEMHRRAMPVADADVDREILPVSSIC